jgi:Ca2+-transporting ATPase
MTVLLLGGYFYTLETYGLVEARTQLFTALVLMELANAVNARSLKYTVFKVGVFKNKFLWFAILSSLGLQLMVLYIPALHDIFKVTYPQLFDWAVAIAFTLIVFFSIEIGKYVASRRRT